MHTNEAFDPVTGPRRGERRGLLVRNVFGQVTAFQVEDHDPAACATVLALIHRLSAGIGVSGSVNDPAAAFGAGDSNRPEPLRRRCPWRAKRPCVPMHRDESVRGCKCTLRSGLL
jgi:hypothetical protein